jgi:NH3-dependent NAD+ synthetase
MDFKQQHARIIRFLQDEFSRWPGEGVVLPFYPSLETALCAIWSVEALGPERVHLAWHMSSGDQDLAEQLSSRLQCKLMPIQARPLGTLRLNSLAEQMLRHSQVVELAEKNHWVILGQASRTRLSLGLQTYHAIGAAAINPVAHLYQRQIVQMASSMAASESLFTQFLQRDLSRFEQGLKPGLTLEEVDLLLNWLLDHRLALAWLLEQGESEEKVLWLYQAMRQAVLEQAKPSAL